MEDDRATIMRKSPETLANDAALALRSLRSGDVPEKFHGIDFNIGVQAFGRAQRSAQPMAARVAAGEDDPPHHFAGEHDADLLFRRVERGGRPANIPTHRLDGRFQGRRFPARPAAMSASAASVPPAPMS